MKKRVLSLFLVLAMCMTLLPTAVWAEEPDAEPGDPAPFDLADDAEGAGDEVSKENAVAEVDGVYYDDFAKAVVAANAVDGCTLTLLDDVQVGEEPASITGTFTLDLNGRTVDYLYVGLKYDDTAELTSGGLTIIDNAVDGGAVNTLQLISGVLTVKGGEFGIKNTTNSRSGIQVVGGTCTITGGTVWMLGSGSDSQGTVYVKGGSIKNMTISSDECTVNITGGSGHCGDWSNGGTLNISDGEFGDVTFEEPENISISGGEFGDVIFEDPYNVSISGGSFKKIAASSSSGSASYLSELLADGCAFYAADGTYISAETETLSGVTVKSHTHSFENGKCTACGYVCAHGTVNEKDSKTVCDTYGAQMVAKNGGTYYADVADALNSAGDGATVTLMADASTDKTINIVNNDSAPKDITLDLAGHDLTCSDQFLICPSSIYTQLTVNGKGNINADITLKTEGCLYLSDLWIDGTVTSVTVEAEGVLAVSSRTGTIQQLQYNGGTADLQGGSVHLGGGKYTKIVNNTEAPLKLGTLLDNGSAFCDESETLLKRTETIASKGELTNLTVADCTTHIDTTGSGACDYCGQLASAFAASVTMTSGETATATYYPTLTEAITAAQSAEGSVVKLLQNAEIEGNGTNVYIGSGRFTIDWNGFTLSGSTYLNLLSIGARANVTLTDSSESGNGGVTNSGATSGGAVGLVVESGGSVTIEGGAYSPMVVKQDGYYGTIRIKGGVFECPAGSGPNFALYNFAGNLSDLLADGYALAYDADGAELLDAYSVSHSETHRTVYAVEHKHDFDSETGKCACGYTCPHDDIDGDTGICNDCEMQMPVKVEVGDDISYYTDPQTAIDAAVGGTVTLLDDIKLKDQLKAPTSGTVTLDLNGKILSKTDYVALWVDGADITIRDSSEYESGSIEVTSGIAAILVNSGKLTITGGSFTGNVYVSKDVSASISGGSFSYIYTEAGKAVSSLLKDGFSFDDGNGNAKYYDGEGASNVAVVPHTHKLTDGACICGYTCPHDWSGRDGKCTLCGYACPHTEATESGGIYTCTTCGQTMTAAVVAPDPKGTVTYYGDGFLPNGNPQCGLYFAFEAASSGSIVTVLSGGNTVNAYLDGGKALTLILNGKDISELYVGQESDKNTLTVTGSGNIGSLFVYAGNIADLTGWTDTMDILYVYSGGKVTLNGGTFAKAAAFDQMVGSLLAEGYAFRQGNGEYVSYTSTDNITNVTVVKCTTHVDADGSGECDYCGKPADKFAASVGKSGAASVTYYDDLIAAFDAARHGDVITLMEDVDLDDDLIDTTFCYAEELDLNGKTLTGSSCVLEIGGSFTILDTSSDKTGKITSASGYAVYVSAGTLTIENGNFGSVYFDGFGTAQISGGSFESISAGTTGKPLGSLLADGRAFADIGSSTVKNCYNDKQVENVHVIEHFHSGSPCACGYVCKHENGIDPTNGECPYCGTFLAIASAEVGGKTTYYTDLQKAIDNAANGTVKLLQDITLADGVTLNNAKSDNVTLDMNRFDLIGTGVTVLTVSRDMTICGELGTIYSTGSSCKSTETINSVVLTGGHLTITGYGFGAYRDGGENRALYATGGSLTIENASFGEDVVIEHGCTVEIKNGTFWKDVSIASPDAEISGGEFRKTVSIDGAGAVVSGGTFMSDVSLNGSGAVISGGEFRAAFLNGADSKISGGTFGWDVTIKNSSKAISGGSFNLKLINQSGTVEDLLADGYAFKHGSGYGNAAGKWLTEADLAGESVLCVDAVKAPITSVSLTSDAENDTVEYGNSVKLTAGCTTNSDGAEVSQKWYSVAADGTTEEIVNVGASLDLNNLNAGQHKYRVTYTCDGYTKSAEITITVNAIDIKTAAVTPSGLTYNGTEQTPTVTVKLGETTLTKDTDYTVSVDKRTNAGSYTLTVEGTGNYTGKVGNVEWKIAPKTVANLTISVASCTYNGSAQTPTVELKDGDTVIPTSEYTVAYSDNINAGTATVAVKAKDGGNYQFGSNEGMRLTKNFTIAKAEAPVMQPVELTVVNGVEKIYLFDLPELPALSDPCKYGSVRYEADVFALTGGYEKSTATIAAENKLQLTVPQVDSEEEHSVGTVTIKITTDNYQDITLTCNFTAKNKITPVVDGTVSAGAITYGQALNESTITGRMKDPDTGTEVTGTFAWKDSTVKPSADHRDRNTTADWVFTPDAPEYVTAIGTTSVVVKKTQLTNVSVEQDGTLTYNGGAQTATVKTAFTAADDGTTIRFGYSAGPLKVGLGYNASVPAFTEAGEHTVYYDAYDIEQNHEDYKGQFTVTIEPKAVTEPTIIVSGAPFTYTGEEIRPTVTVKDGDRVIDPAEYTVSYSGNTNAGTATVAITDKDGGNYVVSGSTTFEIAKADYSVTKAPAANTLTYNGSAQPLVTAGTASGGTMMYRLSDSGEFSPDIPTAVNAGKYTVYYKVAGDANHNDTTPQNVEVTVKQAPVTVTAKDKSAYVGGTAPVLPAEPVKDTDYTVSEMYGTDTLEGTVTLSYDGTPDMTKAGTATIKISGTLANNNYAITYVDGMLTISTRPSSGGGPSTYPVNVPSGTKNGSVSVSPKNASKGSTVTITVKPDSGYQMDDLTVTDKDGNELKLTNNGNGQYTFTMPAGKVSVEASFVKAAATGFVDVPANAYFADAVEWAVDKGITNGLSDAMFGPYESCTRAQIVTFLWRAAGSPEPKAMSSFSDVPASAYYAKAVAWAVENGITNGMTETTFAPNATCTRGQSVTFLYRALKGTASGSTNFTDLAPDAFYADAVNWAVANNVTNGTSATTFSPNADCTRAEIVTFLYRAYQGK